MDAQQNQISQDKEKLKDIPKWTRRYAQNRTLTITVLMAMTMLFSIFISVLVGFPLGLATAGFRKGNIVLGCVGIAVLVAVLVAIVKFMIFLFSRFGGKNRGLIDQRIDKWTYGKEGNATVSAPKHSKKSVYLQIVSGVMYFILLFGSWFLAMEGHIAYKYLQPVSALFIVPYIVCGWYFWKSPTMGPIYLLHPVFYTIHAILILVGVPLFFTGNWGILSICLPYIGYGFLPYVVGHIYSRYALKKLKDISNLEGDTANES